jgi:FdhD protein
MVAGSSRTVRPDSRRARASRRRYSPTVERPELPDPRVALRDILRNGAAAVDAVAVEEPLEIRVDGEAVATTMRTPGADADLALGFLFGEGILAEAADVASAAHCGRPGDEGYGNVIDVRSAAGIRLDPDRLLEGHRVAPVSSACGVCGRRAIEGLAARIRPIDAGRRIAPELLFAAVEAISRSQPAFRRTGGLHAAVLMGHSGELLAAAEDVGRHNAVDKVVGALVRTSRLGPGAPGGGPAVLAVSGRTGFEIVQKAAAAGIPAVASISAPTSLAVDLARRAGIALAGFVRSGSMNLYAHGERLDPGPARDG